MNSQPFSSMSLWLFFLHGCQLPASVFSERESCGSFVSMTLAGFSLNSTHHSSGRLLEA